MRKDPTVYILRFSLYCIRYLMYLMYRFQTLIHIIVLLSCLVVFSIHYFQILFCCLELFCQLNRLQDGLRVQSYQYSILNLYYFFNLDCKDIQINVKYLIILSRITVTKACNVNYKKNKFHIKFFKRRLNLEFLFQYSTLPSSTVSDRNSQYHAFRHGPAVTASHIVTTQATTHIHTKTHIHYNMM